MTTTGVAAVSRALQLLSAFDQHDRGLTLTELARRTGLYKSTALRLLKTLESEGFILRRSDDLYYLGAVLWRLGGLYESATDLRAIVLPVLESMAKDTLETTTFDIREGDKRVTIFRVEGQHSVRIHSPAGAILPLGVGASGRVLQDFVEGWNAQEQPELLYTSFGERDPEMAGIAMPIFGMGNALVGSLCITGTLVRFSDSSYLGRMKEVLRAAAPRLNQSLGSSSSIYKMASMSND